MDFLTAPFWRAQFVEGESLFFVQDGESLPGASLLLAARKILRVTDSCRETVYQEGRDYLHVAGARELALPAGSRIPFKTFAQMHPPKGSPQSIGEAVDGRSSLFFSEGHGFHDLQTLATYEPAEPWRGWVPQYAGPQLPRTIGRLQKGGALKMVVLGDSISAGGNASACTGVQPFQPAYPELVARGLEARYPAKVALENLSVGGKTSLWGLESIGAVSAGQPDLVILAFGMNDACVVPPRAFGRNTYGMMEAVRKARPEVEFILVGSMLGNLEWKPHKPEPFWANRDELAGLCGPGAALADMTSLWRDLLEHRRFVDLTGNGVNHPNDFGHRLYAQVILDMLAPPAIPSEVERP